MNRMHPELSPVIARMRFDELSSPRRSHRPAERPRLFRRTPPWRISGAADAIVSLPVAHERDPVGRAA